MKQVAKCCNPKAPIVDCYHCGRLIHTCEKSEEQMEPLTLCNDWRCDVHQEGSELSDGTWVCSFECWEAVVDGIGVFYYFESDIEWEG